jgi:hypothetical protein
MTRTIALCAVLFLLLPFAPGVAGAQEPAPPSGGTSTSAVQTALRVERQLLALDLVSYREAREREQRARQRMSDVLGRLDQALASDAVSLGALESLQDEMAAAREAAHTAEDRLNSQLEKIQERMRRIALLDGGSGVPTTTRADALTGRWRVTVQPQGFTATYDLRLNGTVVSGSYQVDGGTAGSFRGSLVNGGLRLERIDSRGGFDSVWEGAVSGGRIDGTWTTNELVTGQPTRGNWTAVRESGR